MDRQVRQWLRHDRSGRIPTWAKFGDNGVVNFDGTGDSLYSTNYWGGGRKFTMFSVARYTHATTTCVSFRIGFKKLVLWLSGSNMQKLVFDAWLTDINNGKDQLFHIHSASMNASDQGNTYFDGTQVGTANGTGAHAPIPMCPDNCNSAVGKPPFGETRSAKWPNSLPSTGF